MKKASAATAEHLSDIQIEHLPKTSGSVTAAAVRSVKHTTVAMYKSESLRSSASLVVNT